MVPNTDNEKLLEEGYVCLKWLPIDIFISINEYISQYGIDLVKIGSHWSFNIHFWKYYVSLPLSRKNKGKGVKDARDKR